MKKIFLSIFVFTIIVSCKKDTTTPNSTNSNNVVTPSAGTYGIQYVGGKWSNVGIYYSNSDDNIIMQSYSGNTFKTTYVGSNQVKLEVITTTSPMKEKVVTLPLFNKSEGGPGGYSSYTFKNDAWTVIIDQNYPGTSNKKGLTVSYSKTSLDMLTYESFNAYRSTED